MKLAIAIFAILALAPAGPLAAADGSPAPSRPNVVIVLTDDQGYGDIASHGNPIIQTPHLDRLHDESVRFTQFHVDSYCTPTRAALMTGRYAHRVGGWGTVSGRNMLRDGEVTMADVFRHNGYRTGHFGKWHLGTNHPYRPIDRGFDEWLGKGDGGTGCATDFWGNDRVDDRYIHNGRWEANPRAGFECDVFFDAAMEFIRGKRNHPFFVYLAPYNPHNPCSLPDPQWTAPYRHKVPSNVADFYATIRRVDENLGRLRAFLQAEGLHRDTLLLFLTDNGTATGEKVFNAGMRGKKGSPYEGGHRVPCFLHWPGGGLDRPLAVDRLAAHLDLLPTLADLCSLRLPRQLNFDGTSLRPLLVNPSVSWPERTLVLGTPRNQTAANPTPPRFGENCAVMTDRWRLVNDKELYDIKADPGQRRDLASQRPDVARALHEAYERYWTSASAADAGWRGRPVIGPDPATEVHLCCEDWYPTRDGCPWNQAAVATAPPALGHWPVRLSQDGIYRVELRRWPRELDAPMTGTPPAPSRPDAWLDGEPLDGILYRSTPRALPVARARLKIGDNVQESDVAPGEKAALFSVQASAGPADIEATLLDSDGNPLCGAFYLTIRKAQENR